MVFAGLNYLAILVAAVGGWIVGAIYYSVLCNPWIRAQGRGVEEFRAEQKAKGRFWLPFVLSFIADLVMAWVLAGLIGHIGAVGARAGMFTGFNVWLGFIITTIVTNYAFSGRRFSLTAIDSLHWLLVLIVMGAIIGTWGV
jgi:hypothetical protein